MKLNLCIGIRNFLFGHFSEHLLVKPKFLLIKILDWSDPQSSHNCVKFIDNGKLLLAGLALIC